MKYYNPARGPFSLSIAGIGSIFIGTKSWSEDIPADIEGSSEFRTAVQKGFLVPGRRDAASTPALVAAPVAAAVIAPAAPVVLLVLTPPAPEPEPVPAPVVAAPEPEPEPEPVVVASEPEPVASEPEVELEVEPEPEPEGVVAPSRGRRSRNNK